MAGDPLRDYFSLAPASATDCFPYTSSSSASQRPVLGSPPQPVRAHSQQRPDSSSDDRHHPPGAPPQLIVLRTNPQQHPTTSAIELNNLPWARCIRQSITPRIADNVSAQYPTHVIRHLPHGRVLVPRCAGTTSATPHRYPQEPVPATQYAYTGYRSTLPYQHPQGHYVGRMAAPRYAGYPRVLPHRPLSGFDTDPMAASHSLRYRTRTCSDDPIDLIELRQPSFTFASVQSTHQRYQQQQEQGVGAALTVDCRLPALSELLKSSTQVTDTFYTQLQQQLEGSGITTSVGGNLADIAQLLRSNTHAKSPTTTLMGQQLRGSGRMMASADVSIDIAEDQDSSRQTRNGMAATNVGNSINFATFLKPSALQLNGIFPPSEAQHAEVTADSDGNPIDLTFLLSLNDPAAIAICHRLREAKLQSPDGLCVIQHCQNRVHAKGLCQLHGGRGWCDADGCKRARQTGGLCFRHGGGVRCSQEGCDKAAQSRKLCKAHGGGVRCQFKGCDKSSERNGFCRQHGGALRCSQEGCEKHAQRGGFCVSHGGELFCQHPHCKRVNRVNRYCEFHYKQMQEATIPKESQVSSSDAPNDQVGTLSDGDPEAANGQVVFGADDDPGPPTAQASLSAEGPPQ